MRTFGVEVHKCNIQIKRWHNKYENSEPITMKYRLIKKRNELLGHPVYCESKSRVIADALYMYSVHPMMLSTQIC